MASEMVKAGGRYLVVSKATGLIIGIMNVGRKDDEKKQDVAMDVAEGTMLVESDAGGQIRGKSVFLPSLGVKASELDRVSKAMGKGKAETAKAVAEVQDTPQA